MKKKPTNGVIVPPWAHRVAALAAVGFAIWYGSGLVGEFKDLGKAIQQTRDDMAVIRIDTASIKKDVERIDKGQQRQEEKQDKFERDTRKEFHDIREKMQQKVDKK